MAIPKQEVYRRKRVLEREHWYLDVGPSKEQWRSMTPDQQAVHRRWYLWYAKRRAMRELLAGDPKPKPKL